jgi:spermidine synthase/UDP-N-acetylmuramyl pentapeptide synthase
LAFHVRDQLFAGKRVLVSGTQDANDFKNMLSQALTPQCATHAVANDEDTGWAMVSSLASIRRDDRVAVVQASAQPVGRLAVRSRYMRPHLAVITALGAADATEAQQDIEALAAVVDGLAEGGVCLVPGDSAYLSQLRQAMLARRGVPLALFGSGAHCPGRLVAQRFDGQAWWVCAEIEGQALEYSVPLVDESAPMLSVVVLLAAYYLGADLTQAASQLACFQPYDARQALCPVACVHGTADLLDRSGNAPQYRVSALMQMAARLRARDPQGRRIAVLGSLDPATSTDLVALARQLDDAALDCLLLLGPSMTAVATALAQPERVLRVFPELSRRHDSAVPPQALFDAVTDLLCPGDLLLIGGKVPGLAAYLLARVTTAVPEPATVAVVPLAAAPQQLPQPHFADKDGIRSLHLGSSVRQSLMRLDQPNALVFEYVQQMMGWLLFVDPDSVAARHAMQLGLGAGSMTKACHTLLEMKATAIELNPAVIRLCREAFFMPADDDRLQVIEGDAAQQIRLPCWRAQIDALQVDLFDEVVEAPVFESEDFFADCRTVLAKDGCLSFNIVGRKSNVVRTLTTMSRVFGRVALWSFARCPTGNTVVLAQRLPSRPTTRQLRLQAQEIERRWGFSASQWVDALESWVV